MGVVILACDTPSQPHLPNIIKNSQRVQELWNSQDFALKPPMKEKLFYNAKIRKQELSFLHTTYL